jgi:hypothetical protein
MRGQCIQHPCPYSSTMWHLQAVMMRVPTYIPTVLHLLYEALRVLAELMLLLCVIHRGFDDRRLRNHVSMCCVETLMQVASLNHLLVVLLGLWDYCGLACQLLEGS